MCTMQIVKLCYMLNLCLVMPMIMFSVGLETPSIRRATTTIPAVTTKKSTYEVGESSRRTKRSAKRPALRSQTPVRFNLNVDGGHVRKEYDKYVGVSEVNSFNSYPNALCKKVSMQIHING